MSAEDLQTTQMLESHYNSTGYKCMFCPRQFKTQKNFDSHKLYCEFIAKSAVDNLETSNNVVQDSTKPTYEQLVNLVLVCVKKINTLESQISLLNKHVNHKRNKINIINWLQTHKKPTITYADFIKSLDVNKSHMEELLEPNNKTFSHIAFNIITSKIDQENCPIYCCDQKPNTFYIYLANAENPEMFEWTKQTFDSFVKLISPIYRALLTELFKWRDENADKMKRSEQLAEMMNKTLSKLLRTEMLVGNLELIKVQNELYKLLKRDLKTIIEYEFEFC